MFGQVTDTSGDREPIDGAVISLFQGGCAYVSVVRRTRRPRLQKAGRRFLMRLVAENGPDAAAAILRKLAWIALAGGNSE
jgi:hypothetical protein